MSNANGTHWSMSQRPLTLFLDETETESPRVPWEAAEADGPDSRE